MPRPRHTVPQVGPTSERRDTRQYQNGFAGAPSGGAEVRDRCVAYPPGEQSAHRRSGKPGAPSHRQANPEDPFCHAAKREAQLGVPCAASWRTVAFSCQPSAISFQYCEPISSVSILAAAYGASTRAFGCQPSAFSCQLSAMSFRSPVAGGRGTRRPKSSFRLSAISVQLSAISVPSPVPRRGIRRLKLGRPLSSVIRVSR